MIALIDYGAGNTASVANVLDELKCKYVITNQESDVLNADKIIFPGVGEASFAVKKLHMSNLFTTLRVTKKPLLGICLGMQLLCENSKEGNVACLGVVPVSTEKFDDTKIKVPHMGWNNVEFSKLSKFFDGIETNSHFYFAHSYYIPLNEFTTAKTNYGVDFSSAFEKENFYGVQFHPEKSGTAGIRLIKNFLELC